MANITGRYIPYHFSQIYAVGFIQAPLSVFDSGTLSPVVAEIFLSAARADLVASSSAERILLLFGKWETFLPRLHQLSSAEASERSLSEAETSLTTVKKFSFLMSATEPLFWCRRQRPSLFGGATVPLGGGIDLSFLAVEEAFSSLAVTRSSLFVRGGDCLPFYGGGGDHFCGGGGNHVDDG